MTVLFNPTIRLRAKTLSGPVRIAKKDAYLFVNTLTSDDIYVEVSKDNQGNWYQSGGPDIKFPKDFIDDLGNQIDDFNKGN